MNREFFSTFLNAIVILLLFSLVLTCIFMIRNTARMYEKRIPLRSEVDNSYVIEGERGKKFISFSLVSDDSKITDESEVDLTIQIGSDIVYNENIRLSRLLPSPGNAAEKILSIFPRGVQFGDSLEKQIVFIKATPRKCKGLFLQLSGLQTARYSLDKAIVVLSDPFGKEAI